MNFKRILLASLLAFSISRPAGPPTFINLVPITSLGSAYATLSDSTLLYAVTGAANTSYKKIRLDSLRLYTNTKQNFADSATFPAFLDTVTGYTTTVTDTLTCSQSGNNILCRIGAATGTSNATAHVIQHLPSAIRPYITQNCTIRQITDTSTVFYNTGLIVDANGVMTLNNNATAFKNSGTFAVTAGTMFSYTLK